MGGDRSVLAPSVAPLSAAFVERQGHLSNFDSSVNAVSFGFVATAVLILMFLVMAIFERFLRPRSSTAAGLNPRDLEAQMMFHGKLDYPSPKMTIYAKDVSVLMPGEEIPTFIAHPAPCPPANLSPPIDQCSTFLGTSSSTSTRPQEITIDLNEQQGNNKRKAQILLPDPKLASTSSKQNCRT